MKKKNNIKDSIIEREDMKTLWKMLFVLVTSVVLSVSVIAWTGNYEWLQVGSDPNNWEWCYVYVADDGVKTIITDPVAITNWEYFVFKNDRVLEITQKIPVAQKISPKRWMGYGANLKEHTHKEWLNHIAKNWLDPNHPGGGFNLHDLSLLSKNWQGEKKMVVYRPTSKKYHLKSCRYAVGDDLIECTLEEAKAKGLEPCSICNPYVTVTTIVVPAPAPAPAPTEPNKIVVEEPSIVVEPNTLTNSLPKVWIVEMDNKFYHTQSCKLNPKSIDIIQAVIDGYTACPICNPNDHLGE